MTSELADLFTPQETQPIGDDHRFDSFRYPARMADEPDDEVAQLRRALIEATDAYVDALTDGRTVPPERFQAWRRLSGLGIDAHLTPEQRAEEGIARAAAKWTAEEVAQVDAAIRTIVASRLDVARTALAPYYFDELMEYPELSDKLLEFTTADVWAMLGDGFPVTKGIAGRITAAKGAGLIASTGRTAYPPKDAPGPNNGQRLTVWRALP